MATNHQFSIAVHALVGLGYRDGDEVTTDDVASSVNTSASFVRRIMAKLSKAGLIEASKGKNGGSRLAKQASAITLLDVYRAVEAPKAFAIHEYQENSSCAVSCQIKSSLQGVLTQTQDAMENRLAGIHIQDLVDQIPG